jgi:hypothetical protein
MLQAVREETGFGEFDAPLPYVAEVARRLGGNWGLNGKRGNAGNPSGDILAYRFEGQQPQLYDVLADSGGENRPTFSALSYPQGAGAVWIDPTTFHAPEIPADHSGGGGSTGGTDGGTDGTGGGKPPKGRGMPRVPAGLPALAYEVGKVVRKRLEGMAPIPKGTEDGSDLPPEQQEAVKTGIIAVATVSAGFALLLAQSVQAGSDTKVRRGATDGELSTLNSMMDAIAPKE